CGTYLLPYLSLPVRSLFYVLYAVSDHRRPLCLQRVVRHRALHSFPTRRSSDLGGLTWHKVYYIDTETGFIDLALDWRNPNVKPRSEEHTSELQSRVDLVCRLLLEKKTLLAGDGMGTSRALERTLSRPRDLDVSI